jgi:hypothetical protein
MAARNLISVITSVLVAAIAGAALLYGVELVRYEAAEFSVADVPPEVAASFSDFVGLRGRARRALTPTYALDTASRGDIEDVLVVEPTNGPYWLALAKTLDDGGAPQGTAISALHMSEAVEPREAQTMAQRVVFILNAWEKLSQSDQQLAIVHLVENAAHAPGGAHARIVRALAAKSEATRAAIKSALIEKSGGDRALATDLGL